MAQQRSKWFCIPSMVAASAMLTGLPGAAYAPLVNAHGEMPFDITTFELNNGLQVILVEDHSAPTVAVSVWYQVGGANDPEGRSGFAHLFEHLMFQGSDNVPRGKHAEWISAAGGNHNASTWVDRTNYFEELPSHQLPLALWLEADRMRSLAVDEDNFNREREVVKEEYRQRVENQPYGQALLKLQTIAYDYGPYQKPVIGSVEDLDRATVEEVRQFHATYYTPNNAVLTVAGDINAAQARDLIERYFGDIPRRPAPPPLPPYSFTFQRESQNLVIEDKLARVPAMFMVYRIPPRGHPDYYAAELAAHVLGQGDSSRLAQALIDTGLATSASAATVGNLGPSLMYVVLVPNPGVDVGELARIYDEELARIQREGVDRDELTKAINTILTAQVSNLEAALGLAESVQAANLYLNDPTAVLAELENYRRITNDDVRRVAREYLNEDASNTIEVTPSPVDNVPTAEPDEGAEEGLAQATAESEEEMGVGHEAAEETAATEPPTLPQPLPVREFTLPDFTEATLSTGLRVVVAPERSLPLLTVQLIAPGGESAAPRERAGLSEFAANLLPRGTEQRTAQEIARAIEQVGGELTTAAYDTLLKATITVLSEHTDLAFELLEDVALHPSFPAGEVENERQRALTNLEAALASPVEVGYRAFDAIVYGPHPYGQLATGETIQAISREDIISYYRRQLDPTAAFLVIAGDIAPEAAIQHAEAAFGKWTARTAAAQAALPRPPQREQTIVYLVDRPGSTQAEVLVGHLGLPGASADRYAAQVANQVLGASSTSRLFLNLREKKGYTYGVYSAFTLPRDVGKFVVQAAVRNEVVEPAIREILGEMARLRLEPVPSDELRDAKSYLTGSFALRLETLRDLTGQVVSLKVRDLPLSDLRSYPQGIAQVDDRTVLEAARTYIHPEAAAIVVVSDAAKVRSQLERIAPVVEVNTEGQPIGD